MGLWVVWSFYEKICFLDCTAHRCVDRVARRDVFEVVFRVMMDDVDIELALHVSSSENSWNLLHA